jgi:hypothetical protein
MLTAVSGSGMLGQSEVVSPHESGAQRETSGRKIGGINNAISRDLENLHLWSY